MKPNKKIADRRAGMKISDIEVSSKTGLTVCEYGDVERYEDEVFNVVKIRHIKKICEVLGFDFFELFEKKCSFCEDNKQFLTEYALPRNELIKKRRIKMELSEEHLGDKVGFYKEAILDMENDKDFLEGWCIENITELAKVMDIPTQILIDVKCKKCGR